MLLTITSTHNPAADIGYLLHKNPTRTHSFNLSFGKAHVFYPELSETKCTVALLLDIDTVGLVRGRNATLEQYVNDRPYVASSFLSVALAQLFREAMNGKSREREELAEQTIALKAHLLVRAVRWAESYLFSLTFRG